MTKPRVPTIEELDAGVYDALRMHAEAVLLRPLDDAERDACSAITSLAEGCLARMVANAHRGDWRDENPGMRGQRMYALHIAEEKLGCMAADSAMPRVDDALPVRVDIQAADVANWAWLLAHAARDAIDARRPNE